MKNVLFLVTGMTPQIITETLWALACDPNNPEPWIPDEVHVLSTEFGLDQIRSRLFGNKEEDKRFQQFKQQYPQLSAVDFANNAQFLHVIKNANGEVLNDLKTPEDNEVAADMICEKIREFAQDDDVSLHVSIAGGRKTMGFYAGYALSLYGRAQDRMSHVLVDERYESAREFFYPSLDDNDFVTNREGIELKSKDASIWLANIPFIRMKDAIKQKHQLNSDDSFSHVVTKINESFKDVSLTIKVHEKAVYINDSLEVKDLPPREFAFLHWFADRKKRGLAGVLAPTVKITDSSPSVEGLKYVGRLTSEFATYYQDLKNTEDIDMSMDKTAFQGAKCRLNESFQKKLGLELAAKLQIEQTKKGQPFYLNIDADSITIVDSFKGEVSV